MKFRKKPVVIEAMQWTGNNLSEIEAFINQGKPWGNTDNPESIVIHTLKGNHTASKGDWIIKGVKGEFYPCKPDIFEQTYESIQED